MTRDPDAARLVRWEDYSVDLQTWEVSVGDRRFRLQEKPLRLLEALLERPGEVVTRSELRERLWPDGAIVEFDNNLNSAMATLRAAFGDSARSPRLIQTLPRLGYRLIGEVCFDEDGGAPHAVTRGNVKAARPARFRRRFAALGVVATAALAAMGTIAAALLLRPSETSRQPADEAELVPEPVELQPVELQPVESPGNTEARRAWERGLYLLGRAEPGDLALALEAFRETTRRDREFAPAHVMIADTLASMSFGGQLDGHDGLTRARVAAGQALALKENLASAHRIRALAYLHLDWDFLAAGHELELALRSDPNDAPTYLAVATFLSAVGESDLAVGAAQRAVELDPASSLLQADLGYFLLAAGHIAEALATSTEILEVEPDFLPALTVHRIAARRLGRWEESVRVTRRNMELRGATPSALRDVATVDPQSGWKRYLQWELQSIQSSERPSAFRLALRYALLNEETEALDQLERAVKARELNVILFASSFHLERLRDHPRFVSLEQKIGAPGRESDVVVAIVKLVEDLLRRASPPRLPAKPALSSSKSRGMDPRAPS